MRKSPIGRSTLWVARCNGEKTSWTLARMLAGHPDPLLRASMVTRVRAASTSTART